MDKVSVFYSRLTPMRKGLILFFIAFLMIVPWLGQTEFNTKGEPREAVVSMSMLQQDNWVLPTNNDIDIPYKPMMFHWAGAITAMVLGGGEVTEFTSRLPSALALALIAGMTCWFYSRYSRFRWEPALAAAILITCFEMHRSGVSARVDMMLTFWMTASFLLLYRWWNRRRSGNRIRFLYKIPWLAVLCMSGAMLSKGPVGILLPCLVMGVFMLLKGENFWKTIGWMSLFALLALVLPLWWYYSAWKEGGDAFLELVMEENFGRMTGTMTYESHSNPWHYNFWITAAGFMPWTLLAIFGGIGILLKRVKKEGRSADSSSITTKKRIGFCWKGSDAGLYSLIALAVVIIFFCLPASKRSVYLMPAYPFIAWWGSRFFIWLGRNGYAAAIRLFGSVLALICLMVEIAFVAVKFLPPGTVSFSGRHASANYAMFDALRDSGFLSWAAVAILFGAGVCWFLWKGKLRHPLKMLGAECAVCGLLFAGLDAGLQPPVMNTKSLKNQAYELNELSVKEGSPVYEFIEFGENAVANKYHFFELDFYLGDKMRNFKRRKPDTGLLAIPRSDVAYWLPEFEKEGYDFDLIYSIDRPNRKEKIDVYEFSR